MGDNQARDQQKEAIKGPPSLSLSAATSSPPSRKRLLADLKPKQGLAAVSPESYISADSLSDRFHKKTRESPNFSNCHGCGLRINYSNPKERLQTLDSVWRIVLLCKKCFKHVESAEICSYCFSGTCEEGCFRCTGCNRCIHKDCVVKFGRFPPWSYCYSESSCVDCWVPKLLVKSTRVYRRRKKNVNKSVREPGSVGDSRVSVNSINPKMLHGAVKNANLVLEKKIAVVAKAKENAVGAKSAVELANGKVGLVAKKDENHGSCSSDATTNADVDDVDLAFQLLHRGINSSPRISKDRCLLNSSCLAVSNSRDFKGSVPVKSAECRGSLDDTVFGKFEVCVNHKLNDKKNETTVSEPSVCLRVSDIGICIDLGNLIGGELTDNGESVNSKQQDMRNKELHSKECTTQGSQKCTENSNMLHGGDCNRKPDRCLLKYSKRRDRNRAIVRAESCNRKPDRYLLKYKKRPIKSKADYNTEPKFHHDSLHLQNKDSAHKCDGNSNMLPDGRCNGKPDRYILKYSKRPGRSKQFQSCAVHVQ